MLTTVLWLMLLTFGTYRIAMMIATEDGPFDIFYVLRDLVRIQYGNHWLTRGIHCPLCISFWLSFVAALPLYITFGQYLVYALGIAGMVTFLVMVAGIPAGEDD